MKLAVIILNHGAADEALDSLAALAGEMDGSLRAIVVDDGSGDGCAERIQRAIWARGFAPWARLLRANGNTTATARYNRAIRSEHAAAYLLLDREARVQPGAIAALRQALQRWGDTGVIGPCLLDGSRVQPTAAQRVLAPAAALFRVTPDAPADAVAAPRKRFDAFLSAPHQAIEPDLPVHGSVLIRREVIDEIGLLHESHTMFFEDLEYCRRVRAAGFEITYFPDLEHAAHGRAVRGLGLGDGLAPLRACAAWARQRLDSLAPRLLPSAKHAASLP
jgi:N-acetylglucosaminyl-diphospho-decaprenol L-rhamnosyltransferase